MKNKCIDRFQKKSNKLMIVEIWIKVEVPALELVFDFWVVVVGGGYAGKL